MTGVVALFKRRVASQLTQPTSHQVLNYYATGLPNAASTSEYSERQSFVSSCHDLCRQTRSFHSSQICEFSRKNRHSRKRRNRRTRTKEALAEELAAKLSGVDLESMSKSTKPTKDLAIEFLGLAPESMKKSTNNQEIVAEATIRKESIGSRSLAHLNLRRQEADLHPKLKEAMEDPNWFHGIKGLALVWTEPSQPASQHPAVQKVLRDINSRQ